MTVEQVAVNAAAIRAAAERLERAGYDGDAVAFTEGLVLAALASGFRRLEPPPPLRGPGSSRAAIDEAKAATAEAVERARTKRTEGGGR